MYLQIPANKIMNISPSCKSSCNAHEPAKKLKEQSEQEEILEDLVDEEEEEDED